MMQANWSLILNVLLLVGVIVAIGRLMKARRQCLRAESCQTDRGATARDAHEGSGYHDDIIAVRKVNAGSLEEQEIPSLKNKTPPFSLQPRLMPEDDDQFLLRTDANESPQIDLDLLQEEFTEGTGPTVMMFLLAKENRQFAGYELLQTVLAAGLRFGEGGLFHRQTRNGSVICSLAAATSTGVFDLQNIGAFSVRGLCLYMQATNNPRLDAERFSLMLDIARQLSEGLDAHVLDDQRRPLTEERISRYYQMLQLDDAYLEVLS